MILVKNFIKTGFSAEDADILGKEIESLFINKDKIILDFSEVKMFTTLFFNNALAKYLVQIGPEKYAELFEVKNLSEVGEVTYQHSLDNAKEYYKLNTREREEQESILSDIE